MLNNNIQINKDKNKYKEQKLKVIIDNTKEFNNLKKKNKNNKFDNNLNKNKNELVQKEVYIEENEITLIYDFKKLDDNKKFDNEFKERVKKVLGETKSKKIIW